MGWRYRRSIKIASGIRLNASLSGLSMSVGPRGAKLNFGPRGTYASASLLGFHQRQKLSSPSVRASRSRSRPGHATESQAVEGTAQVSPTGQLVLVADDGTELDPFYQEVARKQNKAIFLDLLERVAKQRNDAIEELGSIHLSIPDPRRSRRYEVIGYAAPEPPPPLLPVLWKPTIWSRLFKSARRKLENVNTEIERRHAEDVARWQSDLARHREAKAAHDEAEQVRKHRNEVAVLSDVQAMEGALDEALASLSWPRETLVTYELGIAGQSVSMDVDLPEVEDMPLRSWIIATRELELRAKDISATRVRELYMRHVHGIGLRLAGEVFAVLPACKQITLSAYSQRPNRETGRAEDQYLYSCRVTRDQWLQIDFDNLNELSPVEAFEGFETRRIVSKTGVFKPVEPLPAH